MIKMNVSFNGLEATGKELLKLSKRLDVSLVDMKNELADYTAELAKIDMELGSKTGRIYTRSRPPRIHQASAPGESPAVDLRTFIESIEVDHARHPNAPARVGSNDFRGEIFEHGGGRILPRPWLWPAMQKAGQEALRIMRKHMDRAVK